MHLFMNRKIFKHVKSANFLDQMLKFFHMEFLTWEALFTSSMIKSEGDPPNFIRIRYFITSDPCVEKYIQREVLFFKFPVTIRSIECCCKNRRTSAYVEQKKLN